MFSKLQEMTAGVDGESLEERINKLCDTRQPSPDWDEEEKMMRKELEPKYVIVKDGRRYSFRARYTDMHRSMLSDREIMSGACDGGGFWGVNGEEKLVTLYDSSSDFGRPKHIEEAIRQDGFRLLEILGRECDKTGEVHDLSGYAISYIDAIGHRHYVEPMTEQELENERMREEEEEKRRYSTIYTGERHKHYCSQQPKDYAKKKKAKRRQQKKSRKH